MSINYLAALLAPREIAPHPNFRRGDDSRLTDAERLALHFMPAAWQDRPSVWNNSTTDDVDNTPTRPFVDLCIRATRSDSYEEGTDGLAQHVRDASADGDFGEAAPGALVASVMLGEMDRHQEAIALLEGVLNAPAWPLVAESDARILKAVLLCQLAMRRVEAHGDVGDAMAGAADNLRNLNVSSITPFPTSPGVAWKYRTTARRIVAAQRYVVRGLATRTEGALGRRWVGMVQSDPPPLLRQCDALGLEAYGSLVQQRFDRMTLSNVRKQEALDADRKLWQVLMRHELHGDWYHVQHWRLRLGQVRLLDTKSPAPVVAADALQLIRHSGDTGEFIKALRSVRTSGPLLDLQAATRLVVERRLTSISLRKGELATLQFGGHLLSEQEADRALTALLRAVVEQPYVSPGGGWQHPGARLGDIVSAALEVARAADAESRLAAGMLEHLISGQLPIESLSCIALSKLVSRLDWSRASSTARQGWLDWAHHEVELDDPNSGHEYQSLRQAVEEHLREDAYGVGTFGGSKAEVEGLRDLVGRLNANAVSEGGRPLDASEVEAATKLLAPMLSDIRDSAGKGIFRQGGFSPSELAVLVAVSDSSVSSDKAAALKQELWGLVMDLLADPRVGRTDKTPALRRLRMNAASLPVDVLNTFSERLPDILNTAPTLNFFSDNDGPDVYTEGLRAALSLGAVESSAAFATVARLLGSTDEMERVEGAMCLASAAAHSHGAPYSWAASAALSASFDSSANVRAHGGLALASLNEGRSVVSQDIVIARLKDLLSEDGALTPILVLRGLLDNRDHGRVSELLRALEDTLQQLASGHPLLPVRNQARELLARTRR